MTDLKFYALYEKAIKLLDRADHLLDEAFKSHSKETDREEVKKAA